MVHRRRSSRRYWTVWCSCRKDRSRTWHRSVRAAWTALPNFCPVRRTNASGSGASFCSPFWTPRFRTSWRHSSSGSTSCTPHLYLRRTGEAHHSLLLSVLRSGHLSTPGRAPGLWPPQSGLYCRLHQGRRQQPLCGPDGREDRRAGRLNRCMPADMKRPRAPVWCAGPAVQRERSSDYFAATLF